MYRLSWLLLLNWLPCLFWNLGIASGPGLGECFVWRRCCCRLPASLKQAWDWTIFPSEAPLCRWDDTRSFLCCPLRRIAPSNKFYDRHAVSPLQSAALFPKWQLHMLQGTCWTEFSSVRRVYVNPSCISKVLQGFCCAFLVLHQLLWGQTKTFEGTASV